MFVCKNWILADSKPGYVEWLDEMKIRLAKIFVESDFTKHERLEREFSSLQMSGRSHAGFRTAFECKLDELEDIIHTLNVTHSNRTQHAGLTQSKHD